MSELFRNISTQEVELLHPLYCKQFPSPLMKNVGIISENFDLGVELSHPLNCEQFPSSMVKDIGNLTTFFIRTTEPRKTQPRKTQPRID
jgi:hypothetical protein